MAKMILSGEIGSAVTAENVRRDLSNFGSADLEVHLSSPGGSVSTGLEIFNIFRDRKRTYPHSRLTARLVGVVASMGSYIAACEAFDSVVCEDNAVLMLHNPASTVQGGAGELRKVASVLDGIGETLAAAYARRSRKSVEEIKTMMADETWLFGEEIKAAGFADTVERTATTLNRVAAVASAKARFSACVPGIKADIAAHALRAIDAAGAEGKMREMVNSARRSLGMPPAVFESFSTDDVGDGIIRDEKSLAAAVRQARRTLGLPV